MIVCMSKTNPKLPEIISETESAYYPKPEHVLFAEYTVKPNLCKKVMKNVIAEMRNEFLSINQESYNHYIDKLQFDGFSMVLIPAENNGDNAIPIRAFAFFLYTGIDDAKQHLMIFYTSSGSGGKKDVEHGGWFPIFGVAADGKWLCKTNGADMTRVMNVNGRNIICPYGSVSLGKMKAQLDSGIPVNNLVSMWKSNLYEFHKIGVMQNADGTYPDAFHLLRKDPNGELRLKDNEEKLFGILSSDKSLLHKFMEKKVQNAHNALFCMDHGDNKCFFGDAFLSSYFNIFMKRSGRGILKALSDHEYLDLQNLPVTDRNDVKGLYNRINATLKHLDISFQTTS